MLPSSKYYAEAEVLEDDGTSVVRKAAEIKGIVATTKHVFSNDGHNITHRATEHPW